VIAIDTAVDNHVQRARLVALAAPALLLGGALGSQYIGGLYPCEMCHWQRWGHYAALAFALASLALRRAPAIARPLLWAAAAAILSSGLIGAYHAGVEAGVFEGITRCTSGIGTGSNADILADIMATPLIRCDQVQWSFLGISMAGWNAILSIGFALVISWLLFPRRRVAT
jgi:disulfide bond formation protein DsbB